MKRLSISIYALVLFSVSALAAANQNLLPNGDVENKFVNLITAGPGYTTSIQSKDTGLPTFWRLSPGASLSAQAHRGTGSIKLEGGEKEVSATIFSDYWKVKDPAASFGLPLIPNREVHVSFYYKTSSTLADDALSAEVVLGTVSGLESERRELPLEPSTDWRLVNTALTPEELLWGARVVFKMAPEAGADSIAWVDSIHLTQDPGDYPNLVHNPSFERDPPSATFPKNWDVPLEDQWVSWIGAQYREPTLDTSTAVSGNTSLRLSVTYADICGISQIVRLDQDRPRPIVLGIRSKLDNSIGKGPPGYRGPDNLANLTVFAYHQDGTMQEVAPTFCLGESDHDWDYRRAGFLPEKPVERIRIQVTLVGTEPTTSLWIDQVEVHELPLGEVPPLPSARIAPNRQLTSALGNADSLRTDRVRATNNETTLFLSIPKKPDTSETVVYLNTHVGSSGINHYRYRYKALRLKEGGSVEIAEVIEKQGYTAVGEWTGAPDVTLSMSEANSSFLVNIPFTKLGLEGPPESEIGFNVEWRGPKGNDFWTGKAGNTDQMGSLLASRPPGLRVRSLRFGNRYDTETDQSQDFITHPPIYAGMNEGELVVVNEGESTELKITAGVRGLEAFAGKHEIASGAETTIRFPYDAGFAPSADFDLSLRGENGRTIETSFPLAIPPALEAVLDQEFYFPEETEATATLSIRLRPLPVEAAVTIRIGDLIHNKTVYRDRKPIDGPEMEIRFPLDSFRTGDLPVQDYEAVFTMVDGDGVSLGTSSLRFGRIHKTQRRPLPAIEKVDVDPTGRIIINDDFRFFPIIPSLASADWNEAIELGANVFRGYYPSNRKSDDPDLNIFKEADRVWELGAYSLPVGPGPDHLEKFEEEAERLLAHPGLLGCYAKQFYYWNRSEDLLEYRKEVEKIFGEQDSKRLLVWGHHDSSLLYDRGLPPWPERDFPVAYCFVKIMGRPGSGWRNAPFLTLTERALNPNRCKLAEVNYYVSWHDDEIVPEHFKTNYSIRADSWQGMRNESYLSVIYGANGLYQYLCHQKGDLQRLRGWFQEMNYMWPLFASDDANVSVEVSPADSMIETRVKESSGKYYLLTANSSETTRSAEIHLEGLEGMVVRKLFNLTGDLKVAGDTLKDTWTKDDAFVYEIAPLARTRE